MLVAERILSGVSACLPACIFCKHMAALSALEFKDVIPRSSLLPFKKFNQTQYQEDPIRLRSAKEEYIFRILPLGPNK